MLKRMKAKENGLIFRLNRSVGFSPITIISYLRKLTSAQAKVLVVLVLKVLVKD